MEGSSKIGGSNERLQLFFRIFEKFLLLEIVVEDRLDLNERERERYPNYLDGV